ncbi:hypothetical protein [Actinomycetospora flava]|uniref:CHAD domain-containing protein n=1 Tax=Actinomycetospora flava TaxID=3129232 RepID=A0ABU8M885_9PSEU
MIGEGTSGAERRELWKAADRYVELLDRIEEYRDPHTVAAFTQVDDILSKHLAGRSTPDAEIVRRELAYARAVFLQDAATRKAEFDTAVGLLDVATRAPKPTAGMLAVHDALLVRLRAVRALAPGTATVSQRRVRSALRRIRKVFGPDRFDAWLPALRYLEENAEGIARRARAVETARKALDQATGDPAAVKAAEEAMRKARRALQGDRSKLQGTLAELYVTRWKDWKVQMEAFVDLGRTEVARLKGVWEVVPVSGDLLLDGKQTWDAAVLLVRKDTKPQQVQLLMAAQFKAEKTDSALKQILLDMERETRGGKYTRAPIVSWYDESGKLRSASLDPPSTRSKPTRYVGTASGGKFSAAQSARLEAAKVEVNQFWLDITRDELEALTDELLAAVADVVP